MRPPIWLRLCMVFDAVLFLFGAWLAASAVEIARVSGAGTAWGIAFLFIALPVFAATGAMTGSKAYRRGRPEHAAALMVAPMVYAAFLMVLLVFG